MTAQGLRRTFFKILFCPQGEDYLSPGADAYPPNVHSFLHSRRAHPGRQLVAPGRPIEGSLSRPVGSDEVTSTKAGQSAHCDTSQPEPPAQRPSPSPAPGPSGGLLAAVVARCQLSVPPTALIALTSAGITSFRSPITAYSAREMIGASASVFTATMCFADRQPAMCWIAPLIPQAR